MSLLKCTPAELIGKGGETSSIGDKLISVLAVKIGKDTNTFEKEHQARQKELNKRANEVEDEVKDIIATQKKLFAAMEKTIAEAKEAQAKASQTNQSLRANYEQYKGEAATRATETKASMDSLSESGTKAQGIARFLTSVWAGQAASSFDALVQTKMTPTINKANQNFSAADAEDKKFVSEYSQTFEAAEKELKAFDEVITDMEQTLAKCKEGLNENFEQLQKFLKSIGKNISDFQVADKKVTSGYVETLTTVKKEITGLGQAIAASGKNVTGAGKDFQAADSAGKGRFTV